MSKKQSEESVPIKVSRRGGRKSAPEVPAVRTEKAKAGKEPSTEKKKKLRLDFDGGEVGGYYLAVSNRYKFAKAASFLLLIAFLAFNLLFFRSSITYANMMYLLRDLDIGGITEQGSFATITYTEQESVSFALFRDKLAVSGSSGFRLYSQGGARELEYEQFMRAPTVVAGDKYALAYDDGSESYGIYTAVACVYSGKGEGEIEDAACAADGEYALLTRSDESKYLVTAYTSGFRKLTKYYKDKYVTDLAYSPDGKTLAIASADVSGSKISGEIMLCRPGSDNTETVTLDGAMPLAAAYMKNGNLLVLSDTRLTVIKDAAVVSEYTFKSGTPDAFGFSEDSLALVCRENAVASNNTVFMFDSEGNLLYNNRINERVRRVAAGGSNELYVLCGGEVLRFNAEGEAGRAAADDTALDILPFGGGLLVCRRDGAGMAEFK